MAVTMDMIKALRAETGAGVLDCKNALEETNGDMEMAAEILQRKGLAAAAKKAEREAADGRIEPYVHPGNRMAAMIEVNCETDFVARTQEFIDLTHNLAMQVAATSPRWVSTDDIPEDVLEEEKESYREEMAGQNKPPHIMDRIIEGKLAKFYAETCLLEQPFIRDEDKTVQQLVVEAIAALGENIVIRRFARFEIG